MTWSTTAWREDSQLRLIGSWQDLAGYYVDDSTGTVWKTCGRLWVNCGAESEFRARFNAIYRGRLLEVVAS